MPSENYRIELRILDYIWTEIKKAIPEAESDHDGPYYSEEYDECELRGSIQNPLRDQNYANFSIFFHNPNTLIATCIVSGFNADKENETDRFDMNDPDSIKKMIQFIKDNLD